MIERHRIKIPTLGWMRLKEYGYIPKNATVKSGTVSFLAGRYYVSVLCEIENILKHTSLKSEGIGVDLGLKSFAVLDDGTVYKNINKSSSIKKIEKKLKREQRSLSRKYKNLKKRGEKTATKRANINKNVYRVQRLHRRLVAIRVEYVKFVVNDLVKTKPSYITIEDLNIKGMMQDRHLSKAIASQCFGFFSIWLSNKCKELGIELRQVDKFYPSSKKCSCCGNLKKVLKLSERTYQCKICNYTEDRDKNAAKYLLNATEYTILNLN